MIQKGKGNEIWREKSEEEDEMRDEEEADKDGDLFYLI